MTGISRKLPKSRATGDSTPTRSRRSSRIRNTPTAPVTPKRRRCSIDAVELSPSALVKKLDAVSKDSFGMCARQAIADLQDLGDDIISTEEYEKRREVIRQQVRHPEAFDYSGKTELNTIGAVVAGAKLVVDETRTTRSLSKRLKEECGVDEDEVLYKPLSYQGALAGLCRETIENRQSSVAESYVDYKKQINFKVNILDHVVNKDIKKGSKTETKGLKVRNQRLPPPKTPQNNIVINPLDGERIIANYALEVASTVREDRKQRHIAPIPFNLDILDDYPDFD